MSAYLIPLITRSLSSACTHMQAIPRLSFSFWELLAAGRSALSPILSGDNSRKHESEF
jgi:hypothetical protein